VYRVASFAVDMLQHIDEIAERYMLPDFRMRIGIHVGKAIGGILGETRPRYFVWGEHTSIAEAMEHHCPKGQVLVS